MKKTKAEPKLKSVVFRGKALPCGFFGQWSGNPKKYPIRVESAMAVMAYVVRECKPPFKLTLEVR